MAQDNPEPKARYPRQEVADGQEHGYIGEVEVYDPPTQEGGFSNADAGDSEDAAPRKSSSRSTTTNKTAADSTPAEKPVAGVTGSTADAGAASSSKSSAKR